MLQKDLLCFWICWVWQRPLVVLFPFSSPLLMIGKPSFLAQHIATEKEGSSSQPSFQQNVAIWLTSALWGGNRSETCGFWEVSLKREGVTSISFLPTDKFRCDRWSLIYSRSHMRGIVGQQEKWSITLTLVFLPTSGLLSVTMKFLFCSSYYYLCFCPMQQCLILKCYIGSAY